MNGRQNESECWEVRGDRMKEAVIGMRDFNKCDRPTD